MRMNILNDILEKEGDNRGSVYLYCLEDSWKAFGYSAFYLSLLYPGIKIVKYDNPDHCCPEKFYHSVSCLGPLPSGTLAVRSV